MAAPSIAVSTNWDGGYSVNASFTPDTGSSNRALVAFIAHFDPFTGDRTSVQFNYDNTAADYDLGHDVVNNGSFQWDTVMVDVLSFDETGLAALASSANAGIQNCGQDILAVLLDLAEVADGEPDAYDGTSGTGTSSTVNLTTTLAGAVDMTHSWSGSRKYAHRAVAVEGSDGNEVLVVDILAIEDGSSAETITSTGQTIQRDADDGSSLRIVVSYKVVSAAASGPQGVDLTLAAEEDTAATITVGVPGTGVDLSTASEEDHGETLGVEAGGGIGPAVIGHWRDSTGGQLGAFAWAGFSFDTEIRNDGYTSLGGGVFSFDEAGHYLVIATLKFDRSSGNRALIQARIEVNSGPGISLFTSAASGYLRNATDDTLWVKVIALVANASAADEIVLTYRRDLDATDNGSVAGESDVQIVKIDYEAAGIYVPSTTGNAYGGTTPTDVDIGSTVLETDSSKIERSGNTVTMKTSGATYLVMSSVVWESGFQRTQRWSLHNYTDGPGGTPHCYVFQRNGNNENVGTAILDLVRHAGGTDPTVTVQAYRGPGVAAGDGGADIDGDAVTDGLGGLCVVELPSDVEVMRSYDDFGAENVTTGTVDHTVMSSVDFNDSAAFSVPGSSAAVAEHAMDALIWANIATARQNVSSGTRFTFYGTIVVDGTAQALGEHGNYTRGAQGGQDCYGGSVTPGAIYDLADEDTIAVRTDPLPGASGGADDTTVADWSHFVAIDLGAFGAATPGSRSAPLALIGELDSVSALTADTGAGAQGVDLTPASEEDTAATIDVDTGPATQTIAAAFEDDTAQTLTADAGELPVALTPASEDDTASTLAADTAAAGALTPASEEDTAATIDVDAGPATQTIAAAFEDDTAQTLTADAGDLPVALTPAFEDDTAQTVTLSAGGTVAVTPASEDDTAQTLTAGAGEVSDVLTPASEEDTASTLAADIAAALTLAPASEEDTAQGLVVSAVVVQVLDAAAEDDLAESVSPDPTFAVDLTPASEEDTAQGLMVSAGGDVTLVAAEEEDVADGLEVAFDQAAALTAAAELDTVGALDLETAFSAALDPAVELDTAAAVGRLSGSVSASLTPAAESDAATPLDALLESLVALQLASEVDSPAALTVAPGEVVIALTPASEVDSTGVTIVITGTALDGILRSIGGPLPQLFASDELRPTAGSAPSIAAQAPLSATFLDSGEPSSYTENAGSDLFTGAPLAGPTTGESE